MTLVYNGIQYEIENECEIEKMDDGDFESDDQFQESAWEHDNVHVFLDECIKKKSEILDPRIRRRKIFSDIRDIMKAKGYIFRIESLDRKLRNMKIHYLVSRENNKKSLKRTHWPYYDKLKIIYPDDSRSAKKRPAQQQQQQNIIERDSPSSSPLPTADYVSPHSSPSTSPPAHKILKLSQASQCTDNPPDEEEAPINTNIYEHPNKLEAIRQQILSFEERRTVAAEKILNELRQSNRLKRELLELNMLMFNAERELEEE